MPNLVPVEEPVPNLVPIEPVPDPVPVELVPNLVPIEELVPYAVPIEELVPNAVPAEELIEVTELIHEVPVVNVLLDLDSTRHTMFAAHSFSTL